MTAVELELLRRQAYSDEWFGEEAKRVYGDTIPTVRKLGFTGSTRATCDVPAYRRRYRPKAGQQATREHLEALRPPTWRPARASGEGGERSADQAS